MLSDGTLSPEFNKDILEYSVLVSDELEQITVTGKTIDSTSSIEGNGIYTLTELETIVSLKVVAEDGSTKTYKVIIKKETTYSSKIESLVVKEGELSPEFHKNTTSYSVLIPYEVTSLNMDIVLEDSNASYVVVGNENFIIGNNEVTIEVTSRDSSNKTTYKINAIRQVQASNYLKDLSVVGYEINPEFDKYTLYYEVDVPNDIEEVQIKASKEDTNSTLSGTGYKTLEYGKNTFYIKVTSISGSIRTYTVVVNRKLEEENLLLTLNSSIGEISPEFNPHTKEYELNLPEKTESVTLTGTSSTNTTVTGLGEISVTALELEHKITVTSQTGSENTYNIKIKRQASSNTELETLIPSTGSIEYTNEQTEYEMVVEDNVTTISFEAKPKDEEATVTGTDLTNLNYGENTITIEVTAEDGTSKRTITIKVTRNKDIISIIPKETELVLTKEETKQITYTLNPSDTTYQEVEWKVNDETIVTVDELGNVKGLEEGYTTVQIISKNNPNVFANITIYVIETEITSSVYDINREEEIKNVIGAEPKTKIEEFIPNFDNNPSTLHIYDMFGTEITDYTEYIGTNMTIKLIINEVEYDELVIIVRGDLNGDGFATVSDQNSIKNIILGKEEKTFITTKAADISKDDMVTVTDMANIKNYILGKETNLN